MELAISVVILGFFVTVVAIVAIFFGQEQVAIRAIQALGRLDDEVSEDTKKVVDAL